MTPRQIFERDKFPISEGMVVMTTGKRICKVLECHDYMVLIEPIDGEVFYVRNDGDKIMRAWWDYPMIAKKIDVVCQ